MTPVGDLTNAMPPESQSPCPVVAIGDIRAASRNGTSRREPAITIVRENCISVVCGRHLVDGLRISGSSGHPFRHDPAKRFGIVRPLISV